jgi:hypothetical protein
MPVEMDWRMRDTSTLGDNDERERYDCSKFDIDQRRRASPIICLKRGHPKM